MVGWKVSRFGWQFGWNFC